MPGRTSEATCVWTPRLRAGGSSRSVSVTPRTADVGCSAQIDAKSVDNRVCVSKVPCVSTPELIGTKRAAEILQVHGSTVSRMVKEGRLECVRISEAPASPMLFDRRTIEALAAELKAAS